MWSKRTVHNTRRTPYSKYELTPIRICYIIPSQWLHWCFEGLELSCFNCDGLRDLIPLVQFKKCEKHP